VLARVHWMMSPAKEHRNQLPSVARMGIKILDWIGVDDVDRPYELR
jgi:hypothetical protein